VIVSATVATFSVKLSDAESPTASRMPSFVIDRSQRVPLKSYRRDWQRGHHVVPVADVTVVRTVPVSTCVAVIVAPAAPRRFRPRRLRGVPPGDLRAYWRGERGKQAGHEQRQHNSLGRRIMTFTPGKDRPTRDVIRRFHGINFETRGVLIFQKPQFGGFQAMYSPLPSGGFS